MTNKELGISPAPWKVQDWIGLPHIKQITADGGTYIAEIRLPTYGNRSIGEANARLIAVAPKLYNTLCDEYNFLNAIYEEMPNEQIEKRMLAIAAVLAKAGGESESEVAK